MRTILYVGNDTICTVALPDGTELQARVQNRRGAIGGIEPGSPLRVRIPPEAIRVVGD
jgi:hypothetical protein